METQTMKLNRTSYMLQLHVCWPYILLTQVTQEMSRISISKNNLKNGDYEKMKTRNLSRVSSFSSFCLMEKKKQACKQVCATASGEPSEKILQFLPHSQVLFSKCLYRPLEWKETVLKRHFCKINFWSIRPNWLKKQRNSAKEDGKMGVTRCLNQTEQHIVKLLSQRDCLKCEHGTSWKLILHPLSLKCPWRTSNDCITSLVAFDGHGCQLHLLLISNYLRRFSGIS